MIDRTINTDSADSPGHRRTRSCPATFELLELRNESPALDAGRLEQIEAHAEHCPFCAHQLEVAARRQLRQGLADIGRGSGGTGRGTGRDFGWGALLTLTASLLSVLWSFGYSSYQSVADFDWWGVFQSQLVVAFLVSAVVLALVAAPVLRWVGWVRSGWRTFAGLSVAGVGVVLGAAFLIAQERQEDVGRRLSRIFIGHKWIAWESPRRNPYRNEFPTPEEIEAELRLLHEAGRFDGLITFEATGPLAEAPRIAKKVGFGAVVMGIHVGNEEPRAQIEAAVAAREYVDGYCLGHNTSPLIPIEDLVDWMKELRRRTGKPVTTTVPALSYVGERGRVWREIGDWYCPDVHGHWHLGTTPGEAVEDLRVALQHVTELPKEKPVLLKMISYPSGGAAGLTPENQQMFFEELTRNLYLPPNVHASIFSSHDLPWKADSADWAPPEQFVGLFTADGQPKPAVAIVRDRWPVQSRP